MFNYRNLNDSEFELLSCDIMSKILNTKLYTFSKGRDGGIDVTDNVITKNVVIQVKHYIESSFSSLYTSLKKEVTKIDKLNPKQYFICCAQRLTAKNISEIYLLFSDYMDSPSNIFTLIEFDSFLEDPNNSDILKKHYKLWLESTNILGQIYNRNIFIDCESLLYEIEEQSKSFVQTKYYTQCLKILENERILLILGLPGVGKTVTTKMLALYYASNGYRIRFTTDGEISNLKKTISESDDVPELIILDDCLGQIYFNMKETQENELISLIKYISIHTKKKLLMNSRVTIYNEAKARSNPFNDFSLEKDQLIKIIDMTELPSKEKGLIFYNHLFFKKIPPEYYKNILVDKSYRTIVHHPNYTPRIIEYVTNMSRVMSISPDQYAQFIIDSLNTPSEIWSNEYDRRIKTEDRILLTTLYSLTETSIDESTLKRAYNHRLSFNNTIDITRNHFNESLQHLNNSMILIIDKNGKKNISVINPSVNDFLKTTLETNSIEKTDIKQHCSEYIQIKRLFPSYFKEMVTNGEAFTLNYRSQKEYYAEILSCICENHIMCESCKFIVSKFLNDLSEIKCNDSYSRNRILCCLLTPSFDSFYNVHDEINTNSFEYLFESMDIDDYSELIQFTSEYRVSFIFEDYEKYFISGINRAIYDFCQDVPGETYYEDYDTSDLIDLCVETKEVVRYSSRDGAYLDMEQEINISVAEKTLLQWIEEDLLNEILDKLKLLPENFHIKIKWCPDKITIDLHKLEKYIESLLEPGEPDYDDYEPHSSNTSYEGDPLDYIFK